MFARIVEQLLENLQLVRRYPIASIIDRAGLIMLYPPVPDLYILRTCAAIGQVAGHDQSTRSFLSSCPRSPACRVALLLERGSTPGIGGKVVELSHQLESGCRCPFQRQTIHKARIYIPE